MNLSTIAARTIARGLPRQAANPVKQSMQVQKRSMGGAAAAEGESNFERIWIARDTYPIVAIVTVASLFCGWTIFRYAIGHDEVQWNKKKKAMSVAQWYEHKYPGTESSARPGVRH